MTKNNRIYYACQSVALAGPSGVNAPTNIKYTPIQGLQSVGINTNFNLEPIYQMGQLDLYENFEDIPDVEVSLSKVLDGMPTIYSLAMGTGTLSNVAENRCSVRLTIHSDASGTANSEAIAACTIQPAYLSSVSYSFPSDGNFTEDVTIVGNNKSWSAAPGGLDDLDTGIQNTTAGNTHVKQAKGHAPRFTDPNFGAGIVRRQMYDQDRSALPTGAPTATTEADPFGVLTATKISSNAGGIAHLSRIQSISISMDLGREEIYSLGSRLPYTRFVNFPVEVSCDIETIAHTGDMVGALESETACSNPKALVDKEIKIQLCDGSYYDLGEKNKLQSVSYEGGDTGGGNATSTYSYLTYSHFTHVPANDSLAGSNVSASQFDYTDAISDTDFEADAS
jgi:hypothetical protein